MSHGSQVYNQGITHAVIRFGGEVLCKSRTAHMATELSAFRLDPRQCKRCATKLAKMDAAKAKRDARQ